MRHTLKRSEIVRGRKVFQEVFTRGKRFDGENLRCFVTYREPQPHGARPQVRVGVAVSRALKRAVDRNRLKRLVREAYRLNKHLLLSFAERDPRTMDIIFLCSLKSSRLQRRKASQSGRLPTYREIESDLVGLLSRLVQPERGTTL